MINSLASKSAGVQITKVHPVWRFSKSIYRGAR